MSLQTTCTNAQCKKKLSVSEDLIGKKVRCPACRTVFTVTDAAGGALKAAPEASVPASHRPATGGAPKAASTTPAPAPASHRPATGPTVKAASTPSAPAPGTHRPATGPAAKAASPTPVPAAAPHRPSPTPAPPAPKPGQPTTPLAVPEASPPKPETPQAVHIGPYKVVRKLGEGGMGAVYEAVQEALGRRVALKVLSQKLVENPTALARFQREARAAAAMNHPNIIQVYDIGEDQGYHYFAMEFVDGETLLGRLQREGRLPWQDALAIGEGVAKALQYAHQHSFIHRDIKPENIMVSRDGTIKLADLGLAKNVEDQHGVTATGTGLGTPYYMAHEQGMDAAHVDHRADIYALGITLLHTMTGRRPYDGKSALQIVRQHMERPLPSGLDLGTDLPKDVDDLIHRMCAKDKAERHADYAELIADMERVRTGKAAPAEKDVAAAEPQAAPAPEPVPVAARAPRKSKTPWIIAAAVAAVVIVGVVVFLILRSRGG